MSTRPSYAIIPTADRPQVAMRAIEAISPQVDVVLVLDNGTKDLVPIDGENAYTRWYPMLIEKPDPMNLSAIWNQGLDLAAVWAGRYFGGVVEPCDVAIINDDAIVPKGWFDAVTEAMRRTGSVAGSSAAVGHEIHHTRADPVSLHHRMQGFAFVLAGESGIRADERFLWWCGDDDLDWTARTMGGTVVIPGYPVDHLHPNGQMTPEMHAQTGRDMAAFVEKWGKRPW